MVFNFGVALVLILTFVGGECESRTEVDKRFEYKYSLKRNALHEEEQKLAGYQETYTDDEQIVNNYLEYLKWEEFNRTRHDFPPARPLKLHMDDVKQTRIYKLLKKFPKGGNMHLHHNHVVSKAKIFDMIYNSSLYDNLYIKTDAPGQYKLDFYINPPSGWVKVKDNTAFPKEKILKQATLLGVIDDKAINEPTDSELRWMEMGPLFGIMGSHVINQANISKLHMKALLQSAMDENVQYLETKVSAYNKLYVLDSDKMYSSKHGKRHIDNDFGELELQNVNEVVNDFKQDNPDFIGYKRIINSYRGTTESSMDRDVHKALKLREKYPHLVSGFDLVSEEDKGYSLLFFLEDFAQISEQNLTLPYFFHTGETSWPSDLLTSLHEDDPVPTMDNVYDAILLGVKRVGHGLGYIKHPYLMNILKNRSIAIEVNPISNRLLGYIPDQRHHPAITYLRYGIPVVLGSDDPATFGYDEFTYDWYEAFMSWGLSLAGLKHLASNSLRYSSLSKPEKTVAITKWTNSYDTFVSNTKSLACSETFLNTVPKVMKIFPQEGGMKGGTKVQVFGRNFEVAVCQDIICKFGNDMTKGTFKYRHRIVCHSPRRSPLSTRNMDEVQFSISLDGGNTFLANTYKFTFLQSHQITVPEIVGK